MIVYRLSIKLWVSNFNIRGRHAIGLRLLETFSFLVFFIMGLIHSTTFQCFLKFSSSSSMKFQQFLVPESMDSIRSRVFPTCYPSDLMFHILKADRDTSLRYSVFVSSGSGNSFMELLSPLSSLCSLDWLVLNWTAYFGGIVVDSCCIVWYRYKMFWLWAVIWFTDSPWHQLGTSSSSYFVTCWICGPLLPRSFLHSLIFFSNLLFHHESLSLLLFILFSDFCFIPILSSIAMPAACNNDNN